MLAGMTMGEFADLVESRVQAKSAS
jgi:hypothetical protein